MRGAFIRDHVRTSTGPFGGALSSMRPTRRSGSSSPNWRRPNMVGASAVEVNAGPYRRCNEDIQARAEGQRHGARQPAWIGIVGYDVLTEQAVEYAAALQSESVPAALKRWDGLMHKFARQHGVVDVAARALDEAANALRTALNA